MWVHSYEIRREGREGEPVAMTLKKGDYIIPSEENPWKFHKGTTFPMRVLKVDEDFVWVERLSKKGNVNVMKWAKRFWKVEVQVKEGLQ